MPRQKLGRSWGTRFDALAAVDPVPSSPECALSHLQKPKPAIQMGDSDNNHDRVVHDASIFIGSLPSHIEHVELLAMLSDHFSGYSQIQGIKVVRDNKGGTCAFIQCQNPGSAASLLLNLRSSSRPFLGRYLRYEPARAFRALLVSYRSPRQCSQNVPAEEKATRPGDSEFTELELPTAMKLIKIPGTRRVGVLYNSDATPESPDDKSGSASLLLQPLLYDADTLRRISTFFGPVEHFKPYMPDKDSLGCPNPHGSPRSSIMDLDCWEVKWVHRDDCLNALTTLRRVPHLTVTWAHESDPETHNRQQSNGSSSTFLTPSGSWRTDGATRDDIHPSESSQFVPLTHSVQDFIANNRNPPTDQIDPVAGLDCPDKREQKVFPTAGTRPQQFRPRALSLNQGRSQPLLPPVSTQASENLLSFSWELSRETQRARQLTTAQRFSSVSESKTFPSTTFAAFPAAHMASTGFGMPYNDTRQELDTDTLHRPEFETSPVMQKSSGPCVPLTSTSGSGMKSSQNMSFQSPRGEAIPSLSEDMKAGPVRDPTTVFVGGLEMRGPRAWDERKLRVVFSKYGGIKSVKIVRPTNKRLCFAFVTFDNTESSARAIAEEHNRILDGRPIRVQLRDLYPSRRISWQMSQTKDPSHRGSESPTSFVDDSHDNSRYDRSDMSNVTEDLEGLGLGNTSSEDVAQFAPGINTSAPLQNVAKESQLHNSGGSEGPGCHMSGKVVPRSSESRDMSAGVNTLQRASTASAHAPLIPSPFMSTPYSVPAIAYYPPQSGVPGYGAQFLYQQPFVAQPYMGYPLHPQPVPPYIQRSDAVTGNTASSYPAPTGVFENSQGPSTVYPVCTIGHPATDTDLGQTGTFTSTDSYYIRPQWARFGFDSSQGVWFHVPWDPMDEHIPDQETNPFGTADASTVPTCLPYPPAGAPIQPPPVFVQPFSHPFPYPGAVGPHGWVTSQPGWHGVMPQPSHTPQTLPSGIQFNPPSGPAEITPSKFERNVPAHRYSRRDNYIPYHKNNNNGRGPGARQIKPMIAPKGPQSTVIQNR